jgi:BirA family biotin operon repressor/biotin-[acetyl-CoA-carboxylase] ligase
MNITVLTYDTIDSTNTEALKQARQGADEGLCVVARQQTAGRGRHGRTWVSEKDAGLYFSIVLRPKIEMQFLPLITLMTGVAVHDTLSEFGIKSDIKWVNDLLVDGKKICGILAETTETAKGLAVIVGIGINLRSSNFPPEIADIATSIEECRRTALNPPVTTGGSDFRIETLTKYLSFHYDVFQSENGPAAIIDEWRVRSSYFSGKNVLVKLGNETIKGVTDGLEPNGALRVKKVSGELVIVQAGEVELLRSS